MEVLDATEGACGSNLAWLLTTAEEPMKRKTIYLILSALGAIIPYTKFVPWLAHNELNWRLFLGHFWVFTAARGAFHD
jgi:hypothetical protein